MLAGKIVETGDASLAHELHAHGYAGVRERHPAEASLETIPSTQTTNV
jgi:Fe-S cluster assembly ATP-binding protein